MKAMTQEWVEKAEGDYRVAVGQRQDAEPVYDAICFHAQQCAEKYLKAWLAEQGLGFPKIHDLEALAKLCLPSLSELDVVMDDLRLLTSFAVEIRYPGVFAQRQDAERCWRAAVRARDVIRRGFGIGPA
ncbi:MAG TPA: HEPN domain-containing protein [Armatimonadota bacterium]|nr:HEPN domain-containing protein [Armatimonadota bacterium]